MKKSIAHVFVASILILMGCGKPSPTAQFFVPSLDISTNLVLTDWGVVELSPKTPKHLSIEGKDCILNATPLATGSLALFIEFEENSVDGNTSPEVSVRRGTANLIVPADVEYTCYVGRKLVRFTLRVKTP